MPGVVNVVEPTLVDQTGHCYSFVRSFCAARRDARVRLWVGHEAEIDFATADVLVERHFRRRIRRLQAFVLYRRLLATGEKIFVSTAGRGDLALLAWAARGAVPPRRVYLYFHWFNVDEGKRALLQKIAHRQPGFEIIAPTPTVAAAFMNAGFRNVSVVPYPILQREGGSERGAAGFRHLLFAGAARREKGFSRVVDLVALMTRRGLAMPIVLQTSSQHYGKYDEATKADLARLRALSYPHLTQHPDTLSPHAYEALFEGAICLQPYEAAAFADRVSGVTLDALSGGSPIVTTAGTWIARLVRRFDAGIALEELGAEKLLAAIEAVAAGYARYRSNALEGARHLREEQGSSLLFERVAG